MTISLRLSEEDSILIKEYASLNKMTVSDLVRQSVMEKIENEFDLECFNKAMADYKQKNKIYSAEGGNKKKARKSTFIPFFKLLTLSHHGSIKKTGHFTHKYVSFILCLFYNTADRFFCQHSRLQKRESALRPIPFLFYDL